MDWDVVDDFESQYAEELEMMRDEDAFDVAPPSRRALALASPLLPPGAGRKRPIEESPLPFVPSDSEATPAGLPRKVPRLSGNATPLSSIPEEEEGARSPTTVIPAEVRSSLTPRRRGNSHKNSRSKLPVRTTAAEGRHAAVSSDRSRSGSSASGKRSLTTVGDSPAHETEPYSPPAPYSLSPSPSPSPPHSPATAEEDKGWRSTHSASSRLLGSPRHLTMADEAGRRRQRSDRGEGVYSGAGTPPSRTRTPRKSTTPGSVGSTPASTGRYKRSLDVSKIESESGDNAPFGTLKGSSLMERFEMTYSSLKSRSGAEHVTGASLPLTDDGVLGEPEYSLSPPSGQLDGRSSALSQDPLAVAPGSHVRSNILHRAPPCPYVTVTGSDGRRVYLRIKDGGRKGGAPGSLPLARDSQLLSVPFARLRDSVEEERRQKLIEQSDHFLHSLRRGDQEEESQSLFGDSEDPDVATVGGERGEGPGDQQLWVEKYSPQLYTELLSDDGINRTLLSWLKLWEEVVFGRSLTGVSGAGRGGRRGEERRQKIKSAKPPGNKQGKYRVEYQDPSFFAGPEALDENRRPKLKLALLCGAPGLGKTTLAHVIARHAGYNVVEMNASDDRSPEVFQRWIETSTQMQAVLTAQTKPNCLIIDEIDGAPTAAINVLIDLVKRKETGKKKKGKRSGGLLSRPIICICNDQYAPSLRQLRQHALVLFFPPTITSRLASRLLQVMRRERMPASMSTLMALCEKTGNDIRSCLNTAQFIQRRSQDLTLAAVQAASVGQKDAQRSLFSFWKEIFQLPSGKRNTLNQGPLRLGDGVASGSDSTAGGGSLSTNAVRFYQILSATTATGEYEKMAQGLFENYPHIRFRDPNLQAVSLAQDWMVFTDTVQRHILLRQDYSFISYLPFLSVAFHFLFAAPSKPQIRYPHTSFEVFQRQQRSSHLLSSLQMEVPPHIRRTISPRLLAGEILPPLLEIISPTFRPVSIQLYTPREKQQLVDLVDTMISYSLTYRQERGQDGQYTYILDPNVEELCRFPGLPQRKQLTYSAKQLIAREIEVEKMRRAERALTGKSSEESSKEADSATTTRTANSRTQMSSGSHSTTTALKKQAPVVPTIKEEKPPLDFFGRVLKTKPSEGGRTSTAGGSNSSTTHPLWFRFNEGFSNAVRRPIRIQDLL